jgi:hypothetical protein
MLEEGVLAGGYELDCFHPQWRHPGGIVAIDPRGKVHKGNAIGLAGNGRNAYFAKCVGVAGHDLAFVWN